MLQPCNLHLTEGKGLIEYSITKIFWNVLI